MTDWRTWRQLSAAAIVVLMARAGFAIDSVTRRSTEKPAAGEITAVSQTEIVVTPKVGQPTTVPANDVVDVDYEAASPGLRLGRSQERGGQFAQALESYAQAASESASANANLRGEIEFLQARTTGKVALGDPAQLAAAAAGLQAFLDRNKDHYRYYEAQLFFGEVSLAADNVAGAESAFAAVAASPWTDMQMAGKMGSARILFRQGNAAGAQAIFDEVVAGATGDDPATAARRLEAMLGQAQCLRSQGRHVDAIPVFAKVVHDSSDSDTRLQAEAYIGQGEACLAAGNREKEALTKFLIVDVVPSLAQHGDLHAQALYQLAQLWPSVGQPVRGAEASAKLEQDYPNSEWAKKLSGQ
jgi:hypothetical protein